MESGVDKELIQKVKDGDKQAFDLLVQKYQFRIIKLISRYVNDPSEALDVAQESFIKAYKALEKFREDSAFYTWLYRIAINTAKNHIVVQSKKAMEADVELINVEHTLNRSNIKEFTAPEGLLITKELENTINEAIEQLPKDLKTAITLREREGLSYEEIAGVMACPVGTVRSRIYRARENIERRIRHTITTE